MNHRSHRVVAPCIAPLLLVAALAVAPAHAQRHPVPTAPPAPPRQILDLRVSPLLDMHFLLRALLAPQQSRPALPGLDVALAAVAEVDRAAAWPLVEGLLSQCASAADLTGVAQHAPETLTTRDGRTVHLREHLARLADAYQRFEPQFFEQLWPAHRSIVEQARAALTDELISRQAACYEFLCHQLDLLPPEQPIPVYLVAVAPQPGGFTHRLRGTGVSFVSIQGNEGPLLRETVIHESIHALDIANADHASVFNILRRDLLESGVARNAPLNRDLPHTLMFLAAAETVRRCIDPAHRDYGDVAGYYAKVPAATAAIRPHWRTFIDGSQPRDATLRAIIAAATSPQRPTSEPGNASP